MKNIVLIALALLCTSLSYSQRKQIEKANKEFEKYSYIDAREIYLQVIEDGYESAEIFEKLGDTYYFNGKYKEASKWYAKLIGQFPSEAKPAYYFRASQSYKSLGNYDEADKLMKEYDKIGGNGILSRNYKDDPDYLKSIAKQKKSYELEKVSINSEMSDFGPSFYQDKLVFASTSFNSQGDKMHEWTAQPFLDLFVADMDDLGLLTNVTPLDGEINTEFHESSSAFTKDGSTVYFTRNNFNNGKKRRDKDKTIKLKLYKAIKSGDNFWTNIEELPFNSDQFSVAHPALSMDEKRLYFASDRPGTLGMSDLWYVDILEEGGYGDPINLGPTINTEARETFPYISDQNKLYFSSDGQAGLGGLDIFFTQLNEEGITSDVINLGEPANSQQDDFGYIMNEEIGIGFLTSNRDGEEGSISDDIYRIVEQCLITITGTVFDEDSKEPIPGALVTFLDGNNQVLDTFTVGEDGKYTFEGLAECSTEYVVRGTKENYLPYEKLIETPDKSGTIDVPIPLKYDPPCPEDDLKCILCIQPIYFDFDKFNIRPDAEIELQKILVAMKDPRYLDMRIRIESHTDSRAPNSYNETLSQKRAQSTLDWLVERGIDAGRLEAVGYGERQLLNRCTKFTDCGKEELADGCDMNRISDETYKCSDGVDCSEDEHQRNRRSWFYIIK